MKIDDLHPSITLGEDSTRQFKANVKNSDALASEMAAFANSEGGTIYIGIENDGSTPGLTREDAAGSTNSSATQPASMCTARSLCRRKM